MGSLKCFAVGSLKLNYANDNILQFLFCWVFFNVMQYIFLWNTGLLLQCEAYLVLVAS